MAAVVQGEPYRKTYQSMRPAARASPFGMSLTLGWRCQNKQKAHGMPLFGQFHFNACSGAIYPVLGARVLCPILVSCAPARLREKTFKMASRKDKTKAKYKDKGPSKASKFEYFLLLCTYECPGYSEDVYL